MARPKVEIVDKDLGWAEFFKRAKEIRDMHVKVGLLGDDGEEGGLHQEGEALTVPEIGAVQEFGTEDGRIPSRSFLRSTFDEKREEWTELGAELIDKTLTEGRFSVKQALGLLGARAAADVKAKITSNIPPPNKPSTIKAKGSDHTLIDTGRLRNSVTWEVDEGEGGE